jgi:ankyrin repeat protein
LVFRIAQLELVTDLRAHVCVWLAVVAIASFAVPVGAGQIANEEYLSALERGDLDTAARLVTAGVDIDAHRTDGKTLLILAAKESDVILVRKLIAAGANVDATTNNGGTALMFAAIRGDIETQTALIDAGADVNAVGGFDWTALMVATVKGHSDVVRQLLASGADPNLRDIYGWTPLMRAVYEDRERVVQALLEQPDIQLDARNDQGATALYLAAVQGNEPATRALLLAGADPRIGDRDGRAPENVAVAAGHESIARLLKGE